MRHFPLFLNVEGSRIVLVGGGEAVVQKARLLSRTVARLEVVAPELAPELVEMVADGRLRRTGAVPEHGLFTGARLVVVATGCAALDAAAADLARAAGSVVNVVDRPALSDAIMPAIVDRDPVVVAIGTEGTSPVLARRIRTLVETALEPGLGRFAAYSGELRGRVAARIAPAGRRRFWEWACDVPRRLFAQGCESEAVEAIERALAAGAAPGGAAGSISVVEGRDQPDLLTLRGLARLQAADLVLHDADCPVAVLELARRDAARARLPAEGPARWRGLAAARRAMSEAAEGRQVVWVGDAVLAADALGRAGAVFETVPAVGPPLSRLALAENR